MSMSERWNSVRRFLGLDRDEEEAYLRVILYIISVTALVVTAVLAILSPMMGFARITWVVAVACALSFGMLVLTWRGALLGPRLAFPLLTFVLGTYIIIVGGGIRDQGVYIYPLTMMLAGLLLGRAGVVVYTLLGILAIAVIGYGEVNGLIVTNFSAYAAYFNFVALCALLAFMGILLYVTIHSLTQNLRRARQNERELADRNRELQAIRSSLEEQVAQRTQSAEAARRAAEEANRTLETQMWQLAGRTRLSEAMRGEQDPTMLADSVIRQLCHYLDAPVGLLYLRTGTRLKPVGRYAHRGEVAPVPLGEGLVGQAALDRETLVIDEIPEGALRVVSGLGEALPRHLLVAPFCYEGRGVGVVEIGALTPFSPEHVAFIEQVGEGIAVAFTTAQTRSRVDDLLAETRQQAEALRLREEELRALNEAAPDGGKEAPR